MALTQGGFQAYDFNRMVVLFTMMNDKTEVPCAISTDAMDRLEGSTRITPEPPRLQVQTRGFVMGDPGYESGAGTARFIGAKVTHVPLRKDYSHDVEAMIKAEK